MPKKNHFPDKIWWLAASLVAILAIFFRFHKLGQIPVGLYWDEAAMLVDAKSIIATGQDMHGKSWWQAMFLSYGDYKLPVYIWLASLSSNFFNLSNWSLRLPSALAGLATVWLAGAIAGLLWPDKKSKKISQLLTSLVVAISPWGIIFSRAGFEGHLGQFFLGLAVYVSIKYQKWWGAIIANLLAALATYSYFSVRFVWPGIWLLLVGWWIIPHLANYQRLAKLTGQQLKWPLISLVLGIIIYSLALLPLTNSPYYAASQQFRLSTTSVLNSTNWPVLSNQLRAQAGNGWWTRIIYHRHLLMLRELGRNFADHLDLGYIFLTGDPNLRHGTGQSGLFLWPLILPWLVGFYSLLKKHFNGWLILTGWWLLALLPASVPETTPHALRSLNALLPLAIIIGWGMTELWLNILSNWSKLTVKLATGSGLGLLIIACLVFGWDYFQVYPTRSAPDWQENYQELALKTCQLAASADQVYVEINDNRFFLWVMAYCPIEAQRFAQFNYDQNGQLTAVDHLRFAQFRWQDFNKLDKSLLLVTDEGRYQNWLKNATKPFSRQEIFTTNWSQKKYYFSWVAVN